MASAAPKRVRTAGGPLRVLYRLARRRAQFALGIEPPAGVWRAAHAAHVAELSRRTPRALFLGDSITAAWLTRGRAAWDDHFALHGDVALGIGGDDTARLLWRVRHGGLPATAPRAIVLLIGVNDLWLGLGPTATAYGARRIVHHLRTTFVNTPVLLLGLIAPRPTVEVERVNAALGDCTDDPGVRFLDTNHVLSAQLVPDNMHPNSAGYHAIAEQLTAVLAHVGAASPVPSQPPLTDLS